MLLPRYTIRTLLAITAGCALVCLLLGLAFRGRSWAWAWGLSIGVWSLAVTALVHAAWFGFVSLFARLPERQHASAAPVVSGGIVGGPVTENPPADEEGTP